MYRYPQKDSGYVTANTIQPLIPPHIIICTGFCIIVQEHVMDLNICTAPPCMRFSFTGGPSFSFLKNFSINEKYRTYVLYFVGNKAKGRISKRVFQESKARQNFRKTNISYPVIRTRKKCLFYGNFGVLCFLETPVLRFALLPYYRRLMVQTKFNEEMKND